MMMNNGYLTPNEFIELLRMEGFVLTYQRLRNLEKSGLVHPKILPSKHRLYTKDNANKVRKTILLKMLG